jgi:hypothetical protein
LLQAFHSEVSIVEAWAGGQPKAQQECRLDLKRYRQKRSRFAITYKITCGHYRLAHMKQGKIQARSAAKQRNAAEGGTKEERERERSARVKVVCARSS